MAQRVYLTVAEVLAKACWCAV